MNINQLRIKRMRENAVPPSRKTDGAAGWDLAACAHVSDWRIVGDKTLIPLGWAFEIPRGYVGLLKPRSSWNHLFLEGVIDSDYRGEIFAAIPEYLREIDGIFRMDLPDGGERIAQLVIVPVLQVGELVEVDELSDTTRGTGGHGSTGRF